MHAKALPGSVLAALAVVLLSISSAQAQLEVTGLENALTGKRFILRSYSADQTAKYKWGNDGLVADPPKLFALAVFTPGSVKLKGTTLAIQGTRSILLVDGKSGKLGTSEGTPEWLTIDLGSINPITAIPKLQEALFFPDLKTAMDSLPVQFKDFLPYHLNPTDPNSLSVELHSRQF